MDRLEAYPTIIYYAPIPFVIEKSDLLGFIDFAHLAQVIVAKWDYFKDIVPSQHWLKQRMDEMEKARNFIAHNRMLLPSESQRLYMYVADWNRVIGL
jgi:hypothetical protein